MKDRGTAWSCSRRLGIHRFLWCLAIGKQERWGSYFNDFLFPFCRFRRKHPRQEFSSLKSCEKEQKVINPHLPCCAGFYGKYFFQYLDICYTYIYVFSRYFEIFNPEEQVRKLDKPIGTWTHWFGEESRNRGISRASEKWDAMGAWYLTIPVSAGLTFIQFYLWNLRRIYFTLLIFCNLFEHNFLWSSLFSSLSLSQQVVYLEFQRNRLKCTKIVLPLDITMQS